MLFSQLLLSVDVGFKITFPCLRRLASRVEIEMDFDLTDLIIWSIFTHAGDFDMFIQLVINYTLYNLEITIVPQSPT